MAQAQKKAALQRVALGIVLSLPPQRLRGRSHQSGPGGCRGNSIPTISNYIPILAKRIKTRAQSPPADTFQRFPIGIPATGIASSRAMVTLRSLRVPNDFHNPPGSTANRKELLRRVRAIQRTDSSIVNECHLVAIVENL